MVRFGRSSSWRERAGSRGLDPVLGVELLQNAKAALAGVLAWVVAIDVLGLEQPFLAPWAAVLVVHATGQSNLLASRLLDTTVGVVVGLLVNLLVWPPLRDRAAWARADELLRRCLARDPAARTTLDDVRESLGGLVER